MLTTALSSLGWGAFALNALSDESDDELVSWLLSLGFEVDALSELRRLIALAAPEATQAQRHFACASEADLSHALHVKRDAIEVAASSRRAQAATLTVPGGTAPYHCWPSRVRRSLVKSKGDSALRQKLEDLEASSPLGRRLLARAGKGLRDLCGQLQWKFGEDVGTSFLDEQIGRLRYFGEGSATPKGEVGCTLVAHHRLCEITGGA